MTNVAFESQAGKEVTETPVVPVLSAIYPQEIEIPFKLRILVSSREERDQWLDASTNSVSTDAIADILDVLIDEDIIILSINNLTREQLQKILSERE
jgi:hypothetical protein